MGDGALVGQGIFVVFVGPDGVGKTSACSALLQRVDVETGYFHFRPPVRGSLSPSVPIEDAPQPKHQGPPGRLTGVVRLAVSFLRFWAGYLATVAPALRAGRMIVADRWAYGYLVQPTALRFRGPTWLARLFVRCLPQPDLVVSLTAPVEVIHARKQELTPRQIAKELEAWATIPAPHILSVDATKSPAAIADRILSELETAAARRRRLSPRS